MRSDDPLLGDAGTARNGAVLLVIEQLGRILPQLPELTQLLTKGALLLLLLMALAEAEAEAEAEAAALAILALQRFLIIFTAATPLDTLRAACMCIGTRSVRTKEDFKTRQTADVASFSPFSPKIANLDELLQRRSVLGEDKIPPELHKVDVVYSSDIHTICLGNHFVHLTV